MSNGAVWHVLYTVVNKQEIVMVKVSVIDTLGRCGGLLKGHFVLKSGRHSGEYINKDVLYVNPREISQLCKTLAVNFAADCLKRGTPVL